MKTSDFLSHIETSCGITPLDFVYHVGCDRTSAVPTVYLSLASPSSWTEGRFANLASYGFRNFVCCKHKCIDLSQLSLISRLYRFTFVSALLLPVLRLGLMLPARPQGLGTGGWLFLTRQDSPAVLLSAYKGYLCNQWKF